MSTEKTGLYHARISELESVDGKVDVYLASGHRYVGRIEGHDDRCIVIINDSGARQMITWIAITVIMAHTDDSSDKRYNKKSKW